jgi:hypothetical protein
VNEAAGYVTVTIVKSGTSADPSLFTYSTSNATATAGSDYTATSGSSSVAAAASSQTINVPITNDVSDETNETFTFTIVAGTNSQLTDGVATVTIVDNDDPAPTLSVADVMVSEAAGTATLTITRSAAANNPTTFTYATANGTATAAQDYVTKTGTGTVAANTLTTTVTVSILEDLSDESDESFTFSITPTSNGTLSDGTASVMIMDNDDPVTPPSGETGTLGVGADPIPSNFDVNATLLAASIPPLNGTEAVGAFRFICGAGQVRYDDPMVAPGQFGVTHLHQFYGNTEADADSTFESLRGSGDSTCNFTGTGQAANRSAYWMPAMLDGKGNVVLPDYVQVYYKQAPVTQQGTIATGCRNTISGATTNLCVTIGNGLRFIQGFKMSTGTHSIQPGWFKCSGTAVSPQTTTAMTGWNLTTCPVGSRAEMAISSLKCWDGVNLDTADHMSHLSGMATGGVCPSTHPYLIPQFTISAFFTVKAGDDPALWSLASDAMYPNLPRGATLHFDYWEAWDADVKNMWWEDGCIGMRLNCSAGDLGNGKRLKGASQPVYGWTNPVHLVSLGSIPYTNTNYGH